MDENGLITIPSRFSVAETAARIKTALQSAGQTLFAVVDHAAGAASVGMTLRPTTLLIFGNPKGGTPLMQANQLAGIDLPMKFLVSEDEQGKTSLTYNDPHWLAMRHHIGGQSAATIEALANALTHLAKQATGAGRAET